MPCQVPRERLDVTRRSVTGSCHSTGRWSRPSPIRPIGLRSSRGGRRSPAWSPPISEVRSSLLRTFGMTAGVGESPISDVGVFHRVSVSWLVGRVRQDVRAVGCTATGAADGQRTVVTFPALQQCCDKWEVSRASHHALRGTTETSIRSTTGYERECLNRRRPRMFPDAATSIIPWDVRTNNPRGSTTRGPTISNLSGCVHSSGSDVSPADVVNSARLGDAVVPLWRCTATAKNGCAC